MRNVTGRFAPNSPGPTGLFVDSSAFYAYFYADDERHPDARAFFDRLRDGALPYRPLFTNDYVLDEVVTRLRMHVGHGVAEEALGALYESDAFRCERVTEGVLADAVERFRTYHDHELSFTDHVIVAHMAALEVDHVLTYDGDFRPFELAAIPHDR